MGHRLNNVPTGDTAPIALARYRRTVYCFTNGNYYNIDAGRNTTADNNMLK